MSRHSLDMTRPMSRGNVASTPRATQQIVQLAGDAPDPTGRTGLVGGMSTTRLNTGKVEILVLFNDLVMTVDVYAVPGEPTMVHLYCPRCRHLLQVSAARKRIDVEVNALSPIASRLLRMDLPPEVAQLAAHGSLSIEPFECTWEIDDTPHRPGALHTGATLCRQRMVIDQNVARDPGR